MYIPTYLYSGGFGVSSPHLVQPNSSKHEPKFSDFHENKRLFGGYFELQRLISHQSVRDFN